MTTWPTPATSSWSPSASPLSFVVAFLVIRGMLAFVTRRGYAPFGWLRILIGGVGLALLMLPR